MGIVESPPERASKVTDDLLEASVKSDRRAILSLLAIPAVALLAPRSKKIVPILTAVLGTSILINSKISNEQERAANYVESMTKVQKSPVLEKPVSPETPQGEIVLESSAEFIEDFISSIDAAHDRVWLEFMQFESGEIMSGLVDALITAKERGVDVQLRLDPYTLAFTRVGNRDVWSGSQILRNPPSVNGSGLKERVELQKNRCMTKHDLDRLEQEGIVAFSKGSGKLKNLRYFGGGNHRKFAVVDGIGWLGTMGLTDSDVTGMDNFMLRSTSDQFVRTLEEIFTRPPQINTVYQSQESEKRLEILVDSGIPNSSVIYDRALEMIKSAEENIEFVTQYRPSGRLRKALEEKARQGVDVHITMQAVGDHRVWRLPFSLDQISFMMQHNKDGLTGPVPRYGTPSKPTHVKALMIDQKTALFGSHNLYDFPVKTGAKELSIYTEDPRIVAQIQDRIFNHGK